MHNHNSLVKRFTHSTVVRGKNNIRKNKLMGLPPLRIARSSRDELLSLCIPVCIERSFRDGRPSLCIARNFRDELCPCTSHNASATAGHPCAPNEPSVPPSLPPKFEASATSSCPCTSHNASATAGHPCASNELSVPPSLPLNFERPFRAALLSPKFQC